MDKETITPNLPVFSKGRRWDNFFLAYVLLFIYFLNLFYFKLYIIVLVLVCFPNLI